MRISHTGYRSRGTPHSGARSYAQVVVDEEWPLMHQGRVSPNASDIVDEMRASVEQLDTTDAEQLLYEQAFLERLQGLADPGE